ncbi:MAG: extracellular solute-binding protein [Candidatus Berkelbacteria bacterium]|nr:extracellular solute-binding protein [Candidatus Berkelbacteria bacterium]
MSNRRGNFFSKIRKVSLFAAVFAMVFSLTGCSSKSGTATGKYTLYWWRTLGDAPEETLQEIATNYMSDNPGITIKVVTKDPRTYQEEALSALAAYQTVENAPDILSVDAEDLPRLAPQLSTAPDDLFDTSVQKNQKKGEKTLQYVKALFVPSVVNSTVLNDPAGVQKVYGLPMGVDNLALYINQDLIQKALEALQSSQTSQKTISPEQMSALKKKIQTPPKTWNDLAAIVPYLTVKNGSQITQSAIAIGTSKNVERSYDILAAIMMQNGTQITSDDLNSVAFNQARATAAQSVNSGEEALKFYLRFSSESDPLYTWNDKMPNSVTAFEQGQVAMMIQYADAYRFIIKEMPSIKNSIDVQPLPQVADPSSPSSADSQKTIAKMWVETAPSARGDANRQRAAWNFIYYLTNKSASSTYLSTMKLPSALKDGSDRSKFEAFSTQKNIADTWYKGSKAMNVNEIFIGMIDNAYTKKKSTKEALDSAATDITTILQASKVKRATAQTGATGATK